MLLLHSSGAASTWQKGIQARKEKHKSPGHAGSPKEKAAPGSDPRPRSRVVPCGLFHLAQTPPLPSVNQSQIPWKFPGLHSRSTLPRGTKAPHRTKPGVALFSFLFLLCAGLQREEMGTPEHIEDAQGQAGRTPPPAQRGPRSPVPGAGGGLSPPRPRPAPLRPPSGTGRAARSLAEPRIAGSGKHHAPGVSGGAGGSEAGDGAEADSVLCISFSSRRCAPRRLLLLGLFVLLLLPAASQEPGNARGARGEGWGSRSTARGALCESGRPCETVGWRGG